MEIQKNIINLSKITNNKENVTINSGGNLSGFDVIGHNRNKSEKENTLNLGNDDSIYDSSNKVKVVEEGELENLYNKHQNRIEKNNQSKQSKQEEYNTSGRLANQVKNDKYNFTTNKESKYPMSKSPIYSIKFLYKYKRLTYINYILILLRLF